MKNLLIILLALSLIGCGVGSNNNFSKSSTPIESNTIGYLKWSEPYINMNVGESIVLNIAIYGTRVVPVPFTLYQEPRSILSINPGSCDLLTNPLPIPNCNITITAMESGFTMVGWQIMPGKWLNVSVK